MQGGAVGSKSYFAVVEIHDAAIIWSLASTVAAHQLATSVFVCFCENGHQGFGQSDFGMNLPPPCRSRLLSLVKRGG